MASTIMIAVTNKEGHSYVYPESKILSCYTSEYKQRAKTKAYDETEKDRGTAQRIQENVDYCFKARNDKRSIKQDKQSLPLLTAFGPCTLLSYFSNKKYYT